MTTSTTKFYTSKTYRSQGSKLVLSKVTVAASSREEAKAILGRLAASDVWSAAQSHAARMADGAKATMVVTRLVDFADNAALHADGRFYMHRTDGSAPRAYGAPAW